MTIDPNILANRRRDRGVMPKEDDVTVYDIGSQMKERFTFIPYEPELEPEPTSGEGERELTPLDQMITRWVPEKIRPLYASFLKSAERWIAERPSKPGLSFFVSGPVGVGKTTIIRNLQQSLTRKVISDDHEFMEFMGRFWTAREAMGHLDPITGGDEWRTERKPFSVMLKGVRALVIDDIGREEIPYSSHSDFLIKRRNRYHDLFNFCYEKNISLLVSTNIPIMDGESISDELIEVLGDTAVDRLLEMAGGVDYTFDLSGIPQSYRMWKVSQDLAQRSNKP